MSERKETLFEKQCRENRERQEIRNLNEQLKERGGDKDDVQILNTYVNIITGKIHEQR